MLAARLPFIGARILAPHARRGKTSSRGDKRSSFHRDTDARDAGLAPVRRASACAEGAASRHVRAGEK